MDQTNEEELKARDYHGTKSGLEVELAKSLDDVNEEKKVIKSNFNYIFF